MDGIDLVMDAWLKVGERPNLGRTGNELALMADKYIKTG